MAVSFSLHLVPDDLGLMVKRARLAEETGFAQLWIAESHLSCRDVYVALTLCALNTSRIKIGPGVTNVILRDDSITASTMGTLDELAAGRTLLGIGSGDTPIYMLGKRMSSLGAMRRSVERIRGLLRGEQVDFAGTKVSLPWCHREIPIYLSAEGPRTLQLAGEVADGVIVGSGVYQETIEWAMDNLNRGMEARDPSLGELDIVFGAMCSVDRDGHAAREKVRARVANRAHHNFRITLESVPEEHRADTQRLLDNFDVTDWRSPKHIPFITDYLLDRFTIAGTPEACVERIRKLEAWGVRRLMIDPPTQDFDLSLDMFAREVLPQCI
jgi:5,10-methylenetetrahydromethanopterin reductase